LIGRRNGVGILFEHKVQGFLAWWLWRLYYLGNLPTTEKKLRVIVDWSIDLLFKCDVTRLKTIPSEAEKKIETENKREAKNGTKRKGKTRRKNYRLKNFHYIPISIMILMIPISTISYNVS
jgi:hypothetical protein